MTCSRISGTHEGILNLGRKPSLTAAAFEAAARRSPTCRSRRSSFTKTAGTGSPTTRSTGSSRHGRGPGPDGAVGYTTESIQVVTHGWSPRELALNEARQQCALEIARLCGLDSVMLSARRSGLVVHLHKRATGPRGHVAQRHTTDRDAHRGGVHDALRYRTGRFTSGIATPTPASPLTQRIATYVAAVTAGILTVEESRSSRGGKRPHPAPTPAGLAPVVTIRESADTASAIASVDPAATIPTAVPTAGT